MIFDIKLHMYTISYIKIKIKKKYAIQFNEFLCI